MGKRRILICDDAKEQGNRLEGICKELRFDIIRLTHWEEVAPYIRKNPLVHLLILDLGYPDKKNPRKIVYDGWKAIDELHGMGASLPILVFTELFSNSGVDPVAYKEMTAMSSKYNGQIEPVESSAHNKTISKTIKTMLGEDRLGKSGDLSVLHISDLQAGGDGILSGKDADWLPDKIFEAIGKFQKSEQNAKLNMRFPDLCFSTGDLTQRGRPVEFSQYESLTNIIGEHIDNRSAGMKGLLYENCPNIVSIPGNHDLNWDVMRARSIVKKGKTLAFTKDKPSKDLDFMDEYAWAPYSRCLTDALNKKIDWVWNPGYQIIDLSNEIGLRIICINSARWSCSYTENDHLRIKDSKVGVTLPERIIKDVGQVIGGVKDKRVVNVLLSHHTLDSDAIDQNKLCVSGGGHKKTITELSDKWEVSVAFSGHIHDTTISPLTTKTNKKLTVVGAGTVANSDLGENKGPQFNLVRFHREEGSASHFSHLTIVPFHYNDSDFIPYSCLLDGQHWQTLALK